MNASPLQVADRTALVEFLVANPAAASTLLAMHIDDGHGRCRTCTAGPQRGHPVWPCTLHTAAHRAHDLQQDAGQR